MAPAQRPFRPIQPLPEGDSGTPGPSARITTSHDEADRTPRRRQITYSACKACSDRKSKCDGVRPTCGTCTARNGECVYDLAPGLTRAKAAKEQIQLLKDQLERLIQAPDDKATLAYADELRANYPTDPNASERPGISSRESISSAASPYNSTSLAPITGSHIKQTNLSKNISAIIPSATIITHAAQYFCVNTYSLARYGTSAEHIRLLCSQLEKEPVEPHLLGEICAIAAVGARYSGDLVYQAVADDLYGIANVLFIGLADQKPETALRMSVLLAVFAVPNKLNAALGFVDFGLNIARLEDSNSTLIQKAFNTLLYTKNWLTIALGLPNPDTIERSSSLEQGEALGSDRIVDDNVQLELAFLSSITTEINRCPYTQLPYFVDQYKDRLNAWYNDGPFGRLSVDDQVAGMKYVRLVWFGAHILLYRRLMLYRLEFSAEDWSINPGALSVSDNMPLTAKFAIQLLQQLHEENSLFYGRTWLCIFAAYTSCAILLHNIVFRILSGALNSPQVSYDLQETLVQAQSALDIMANPPQAHPLVMCFRTTLAPYVTLLADVIHNRTYLDTVVFPCPFTHYNVLLPPGEGPLYTAADDLTGIVCRPFYIPGLPNAPVDLGSPDEACMGILLDWKKEEEIAQDYAGRVRQPSLEPMTR